MPIFHVYLSGKKLTTAGVGSSGALIANVTWVRRAALAAKGEGIEELDITVGGLITPDDKSVRWVERDLKVGDEIRIRISDKGKIDRLAFAK
ncbi:MAG TPA: hypothetical protein VGH19_05490 [Verrucomicrobiae bacterium]